jgi:5-oxoprolinase (ATP-hydrolysing)
VIDLVEEKVIEQHNDLTDYEHVDPIQLSVYGHRLMGIAEQVCSVLTSCESFLVLTWE